MQVPRQIHVGDIVIYRPDRRSVDWHDRGHLPQLPGIVTKVWSSGVVNLRVADKIAEEYKVDIRVFLDHNGKDGATYVFVPCVPPGTGIGQWQWPQER